MNIPLLISLAMARGNADASPGAAPAGPPTAVTVTRYSGVKRRISWTTGDVTAYSKIYQLILGSYVNLDIVDPGVVSYDSDITSGDDFAVSHYKNGQETALVDGSL